MPDFDSLVDQIYEASVDPDLWPQVLHTLCGWVGAAGGVVLTRRTDTWLGWRYSPAVEGLDAYLTSDAARRSGSTARLLSLNRAGFVSDQEAFAGDEYLSDPMMVEWGTAAGFHHGAATAIQVPTGDLVVVQVNRRVNQTPFDRNDIQCLDAFRPHLARAGFLAARWRLQRLRAAAEALAMIGLPAAILDATGKMLAANTLIEGMKSHLVWLPKDRIALNDPAANALMHRAISEISKPASTAVRSFPAKGTGDDPLVVHIVPATGEMRELFDGGFAVLALTAVAPASAPDAALIKGLFDLTAAEARVASGVAEGLSLDQIAKRHGVAVGTVRSQVKAVFAKTGSSRQSHLAALLAAQPRIPVPSPNISKESD
jgi:DNA-binding CsgD family transcriptional regulator